MTKPQKYSNRAPRPAALGQIRARNGDAGDRAAADGDQPRFKTRGFSIRTGWCIGALLPCAFGLPYSYAAASIERSATTRRYESDWQHIQDSRLRFLVPRGVFHCCTSPLHSRRGLSA